MNLCLVGHPGQHNKLWDNQSYVRFCLKSNIQANINKNRMEKLGEGPREHQPVGPHWDPMGDLACFQFSPVACFKIRMY